MVRAKKHLGQHFLKEASVARKIAELAFSSGQNNWIEIGPGTGILTKILLEQFQNLKCVELDRESVSFLEEHYPDLDLELADILEYKLEHAFDEQFGVIGNFPYNISSQIVFKILDNIEKVNCFAGMFQLEVAQRLAASPHSKSYGILSVLCQAHYDVKLCFKVGPGNFNPPPKVQSGVVFATRKKTEGETYNHRLFKDVVKTAFNQRRKKLSNALSKFQLPKEQVLTEQMFNLRAENLSVDDFIYLTNWVQLNRGR